MSLLLIISFLFFISVNEVSSFGVDERDCLTKIINGQRSTIAQGKLANLPTASDMNRLEYSKLFEGMAQSLARDCSMHHLGGGVSHFTSDKIYEKNG
uniref:SCP domain-containing protein n=1 Tax=Meloidogyne hapla TaxID=6305 RepID=A0A1I8C246_MELHA